MAGLRPSGRPFSWWDLVLSLWLKAVQICAHVSYAIAKKRQHLLHYASQPLGQRLFYNQTFPPNPYSFGVKDGVAAQLLLLATRAAQKL
jgi:hypothetical protein